MKDKQCELNGKWVFSLIIMEYSSIVFFIFFLWFFFFKVVAAKPVGVTWDSGRTWGLLSLCTSRCFSNSIFNCYWKMATSFSSKAARSHMSRTPLMRPSCWTKKRRSIVPTSQPSGSVVRRISGSISTSAIYTKSFLQFPDFQITSLPNAPAEIAKIQILISSVSPSSAPKKNPIKQVNDWNNQNNQKRGGPFDLQKLNSRTWLFWQWSQSWGGQQNRQFHAAIRERKRQKPCLIQSNRKPRTLHRSLETNFNGSGKRRRANLNRRRNCERRRLKSPSSQRERRRLARASVHACVCDDLRVHSRSHSLSAFLARFLALRSLHFGWEKRRLYSNYTFRQCRFRCFCLRWYWIRIVICMKKSYQEYLSLWPGPPLSE